MRADTAACYIAPYPPALFLDRCIAASAPSAKTRASRSPSCTGLIAGKIFIIDSFVPTEHSLNLPSL